jgi:ribonuclease PH
MSKKLSGMPQGSGRSNNQLRPVKISPGYIRHAEGSALIKCGNTHVICTASVEQRVPPFLMGKGQGWITAEYAMLPRATEKRTNRERGRVASGRSQEIQRMIGRSLRASADLGLLGERTILVDCDVIQADGGTRTASITGAWVALAEAERWLLRQELVLQPFLKHQVAAISVGLVNEEIILDLDYNQDFAAQVDLNVAMLSSGKMVEVQGTAEGAPFSKAMLNRMVTLASKGIEKLFNAQRKALRIKAG